MATDRSFPEYQDGYAIKYYRDDDRYHCLQHAQELSKKNGAQASFKSLKLAKDFMIAHGALIALPPAPKTIAERMKESADAQASRQKANEKACVKCGKIFSSANTDMCMECYQKHWSESYSEGELAVLGIIADAEKAWDNRFETPLPPHVDPLAGETEVVFVGSAVYKAGDSITDRYGVSYIVTQDSYFITAEEAADAEDANDIQLEIGWHTHARKVR